MLKKYWDKLDKFKGGNMSIITSLRKRRSYYNINNQLPVSEQEIIDKIKEVTELVPDAFNMQSARVVVLFGAMMNNYGMKLTMYLKEKLKKKKLDALKKEQELSYFSMMTM